MKAAASFLLAGVPGKMETAFELALPRKPDAFSLYMKGMARWRR